MTVELVFYAPEADDPNSGPVINTYTGKQDNVPDHVSTAPIPDGLTITDVRMWKVQNGELIRVPYLVDTSEVNEERTRRVVAGKDFDLSDLGHPDPVWVQGDPTSQVNLMGIALGAIMKTLLEDPDFQAKLVLTNDQEPFMDGQNKVHMLNRLQRAMLWARGSTFVSDMFKASWFLKSGPIPQDYQEDRNWPTSV